MTPDMPEGWVELHLMELERDGVLALCDYDKRRISYLIRWWLDPFMFALYRHERGHAWGIESCLSRSKFCVMAEDDDTWLGKLKLLPFQVLGLGRYCSSCRAFLESQGAFDAPDR